MTTADRPGFWRRVLLLLGLFVGALILVSLISWAWLKLTPVRIVEPPPAPIKLLQAAIPDGPDAPLLRHGRYLTLAGDCASCHTRAGGRPFTGGLGLRSPLGVIYSPNISGVRGAGIGDWTADQFFHALHDGVGPGGERLYPAFPYTHFTNVSRADADAILAYLKTVPGDGYAPPANRLPFPLDIRLGLIAWNAINFRSHPFAGDPAGSAAWNRGAYLVDGLEHCGSCHTPKTLLEADDTSRAFQGGVLDHWLAPDLTGAQRTGLGRWSAADIVEYLRTGRNARSNAGGPMAQVVSYSTSQLSEGDLSAIAGYIKTLRPGPAAAAAAPSEPAMRAGAAIYADGCTGCHRVGGTGSPRLFPPLAGSALVQQSDPTTVLHLILAGGRTGPTPTRPSTPSMPSFAWKLDDRQIADVATYVRNAWGNRADPVSEKQVADLRRDLRLRAVLNRAGS